MNHPYLQRKSNRTVESEYIDYDAIIHGGCNMNDPTYCNKPQEEKRVCAVCDDFAVLTVLTH